MIGDPQDPLDALKALRAKRSPIADEEDPLAKLQAMRPKPTAPVVDDTAPRNAYERIAQPIARHALNVVEGIPGVEALQAHLHTYLNRGTPYAESLAKIRGATGAIPSTLRRAERFAGGALASVPLAPVLPASLPAAGAAWGAADAALSADPESLGQRAMNTGIGAGVGYAGGKVLKGIGNVAQRTGLTDLVGSALRKAGSKLPAVGAVGEAIGTKGAANELLNNRQSILDAIPGGEQSVPSRLLKHIDTYKAKSATLYKVAEQDQNVIADVRVQQALLDPEVQQAFAAAHEVLGSGQVAVAQPAQAAAGGGGRALSLVTQNAPSGPQLPTPEVVAVAKRILAKVVNTGFARGGIGPAEAAKLAPKVDALRAALHDASPDWKAADAFYAQAKAWEDAFGKTSGARMRRGNMVQGKPQPPEVTAQFTGASGPIGASRGAGAQSGAAARLADALTSAPLGVDMAETMRGAGAPFKASPRAAMARGQAFPSPADASGFESLISRLTSQPTPNAPATGIKAMLTGGVLKPTNPLASPAGAAMRRDLSSQLADPAQAAAVRAAMARAGQGRTLLEFLQRAGLAGVNGAFQ